MQGFVAHTPQKHAVSLGDFADVLGKGWQSGSSFQGIVSVWRSIGSRQPLAEDRGPDSLVGNWSNTHFSHLGRPETDGRLFLGLILLKHLTGLSDREVLQSVRENVYQQAFCGFEEFVTDSALEPSTLTKLRKRLGVGFFKRMEEETPSASDRAQDHRGQGDAGRRDGFSGACEASE